MAGHETEDESAVKSVHVVKDGILRGLQRLNDRSTQSVGAEELHEIILVRNVGRS